GHGPGRRGVAGGAGGGGRRGAPPGAPPRGGFRLRPPRPAVKLSNVPMRRLPALLALAALLPAPAGAAPRLVFDSPSGAAAIPFELYANHIYMRGRVGDSDSLWIVLDTGASAASVSASTARSIGLHVEP